MNPTVIQEEGDFLRRVPCQDLVDILEEALGVDGLRLHDKGLEPILGRYPSQHSDGLRVPQALVNAYVGPECAVGKLHHCGCSEHALVCKDDDLPLGLGVLDL